VRGNNEDRVIAVSGGFDPMHKGHVRMFKNAKALGGKVVAIVNGDNFLMRKKGYKFMDIDERMEIVGSIKWVDEVIPAVDEDQTVCKTLEILKPDIFANGGDRGVGNVPEKEVCDRLGIEMVYNIGAKAQSSSDLVLSAVDNFLKSRRPENDSKA